MKISLCTTCMGRAHHLKKTLPQNIRDNPPTAVTQIEFIVLNYNSRDDLDSWMLSTMSPHIKSGRIRYFKTNEPKYFDVSHAKNIAHVAAVGDVLCNLDADNYLGRGFCTLLDDEFSKNPHAILHFFAGATRNSPASFDWKIRSDQNSTFGRICLRRKDFLALGGYDETIGPMLFEDWDLINRAVDLGAKYQPCKSSRFTNCINHSLRERFCNLPAYEKNKDRLEKYYWELHAENERRARERPGLIANQGRARGHVADLVEVF